MFDDILDVDPMILPSDPNIRKLCEKASEKLNKLVKEGKMGISSRGIGTVDENSGYVNEDFEFNVL